MAIVLVDTDNKNLDRLRDEVQQHRPLDEIVTFSEGAEALEYIDSHDVTEVIVDVNAGSMDGFSLIRTIKQKHHNKVRAILMSMDRNKALYAWEIRADYFLLKPYSSADVGECFAGIK